MSALERRPAAHHTVSTWWRPADEEAEERAEITGEDTSCANCHHAFSFHINGRCPK